MRSGRWGCAGGTASGRTGSRGCKPEALNVPNKMCAHPTCRSWSAVRKTLPFPDGHFDFILLSRCASPLAGYAGCDTEPLFKNSPPAERCSSNLYYASTIARTGSVRFGRSASIQKRNQQACFFLAVRNFSGDRAVYLLAAGADCEISSCPRFVAA